MIPIHMFYLSLNNEELHQKTIESAATEKNATLTLLEILQEVDRRRLYAERGYSSLWMYVHRELNYSESQTSERVGAMRLMARVPEVRGSIENNKLTLTTAAKLASFVKKEKLPTEKTVELLHRISDKSKREVEQILFTEQAVPNARADIIRQASSITTRISFDADDEFMRMLARLKELQADPTLSLQKLFQKTIKEYLAKREIKNKIEKKIDLEKEMNQHTTSYPAETKRSPKKTSSRYISISVKNFVRDRSKDQCEYIASMTDSKTKKTIQKRCESRSQLQFDHKMPFALGGENTKENIRHLCSSHNLHTANKIFDSELSNKRSSKNSIRS